MSCHPFIDAVLELDAAAEAIIRKTGSRREQVRLRDAIADLNRKTGSRREQVRLRDAIADLNLHANEVVVRDVAQGHGDLTIDVFQEVVKRAHEAGLAYPDLVAAFNRAQGTES